MMPWAMSVHLGVHVTLAHTVLLLLTLLQTKYTPKQQWAPLGGLFSLPHCKYSSEMVKGG